jgi:signal transduction histidine kinase
MFLVAIPVGYGYAVVRHQLIKLDRFINRGVTSTLVITLLAGLYLGFAALMNIIFPEQAQNELLIQMMIAIALAAIYPQVRHMVQRLIDWFFYGGWYDYRTAVEKITQGLEFIFDSKDLAQTLSARVRDTLRLESAATLLLGFYGEICEVDGTGLEIKDFELPWKHSSPMIPEDGYIYKYLQDVTSPIETRYIRKALTSVSLADGERKLLDFLESRIWVPIHGHKSLVGLLILGPRLGNEAFGTIDMDILQMVVQHVGACAQNLVLLNELRLHASEVKQLHRRIVQTREEERKLLARELHDDVIQTLVSLNFELSRAVEENRDHLKGEIRNLLGTLRGICRQLRPPALDNLGLITAIRSLLREFKEMNDEKLHIDFHTNINEELWVKEEIAVCLYRVLNEGLRNIVSHAKADRVNIELARDSNEIRLMIVDNGVGFTIPPNLGLLIANDHFGLVGIREWLELVDGNLEIKSSPGKGTVITARVSIPQSDTIESEETDGAIQ